METGKSLRINNEEAEILTPCGKCLTISIPEFMDQRTIDLICKKKLVLVNEVPISENAQNDQADFKEHVNYVVFYASKTRMSLIRISGHTDRESNIFLSISSERQKKMLHCMDTLVQ